MQHITATTRSSSKRRNDGKLHHRHERSNNPIVESVRHERRVGQNSGPHNRDSDSREATRVAGDGVRGAEPVAVRHPSAVRGEKRGVVFGGGGQGSEERARTVELDVGLQRRGRQRRE